LTALAELNKPAAMRLRDQLLHVAGEVKELPGFLALKMAQLDISYATPEEDDWVGTRLPPHGSWAITLRWALLLPPSRHDATMSLPEHQNLVIGQSPTDVAFLVRPDGHVAAASTDLSDSALRELLARTYWQGPTGKDLARWQPGPLSQHDKRRCSGAGQPARSHGHLPAVWTWSPMNSGTATKLDPMSQPVLADVADPAARRTDCRLQREIRDHPGQRQLGENVRRAAEDHPGKHGHAPA
jgi:hypothetical protein